MAVSECAQIVGVLLVFTLMVGPPAAAQRLTTRLRSAHGSLGRDHHCLLYRLASQLLHFGVERGRLLCFTWATAIAKSMDSRAADFMNTIRVMTCAHLRGD
jgi:ABC 3 transport family